MKKGTHCFIDFTLCEIIFGAFGVTFVWDTFIDILKRAFILFYFGTDFFLYENLHSAMKFRILPQRTIGKSKKWFHCELRVPNL